MLIWFTRKDFDVRWDQALLSATETPSEMVLEGLYKSKLQDSVQLQNVLAFKFERICKTSKWISRWELETSESGVKLWKEEQLPRFEKERKPMLRGKWENAVRGKQMCSVRMETLVVSVMNLYLENKAHASEWSLWMDQFSHVLFLVPRGPGECDGVIRSQFSKLRTDFLGWESWDTQRNCIYSSIRQLILSHHPSLTFCLASPPPQHVLNGIFCHKNILFHTGNFDTREDANNYMTFFCNLWIDKETASFCPVGFVLCCVIFFGVLPVSPSLCTWCGRGRLPFSFLGLASVSRYKYMTETTRVSFRTLPICFPLTAFSHFRLNVGLLSFSSLGYCSSFHSFIPDSDVLGSHRLIHFDVLQMPSILNNSVAHCCEQFLGHPKPIQSDAEQNPAILTYTILPGPFLKVFRLLIKALGRIVHRNPGRHRSVDVYWTDLTILVLLHQLQLHENARKSYKQFASSIRIGRICERVALRLLLSCGRAHACREASSMQTQSSHQAYRSRESRFSPHSIAMSLIPQLTLLSQPPWFIALWDENLLSLKKLQSWNWPSSSEIPQSLGTFQNAFP